MNGRPAGPRVAGGLADEHQLGVRVALPEARPACASRRARSGAALHLAAEVVEGATVVVSDRWDRTRRSRWSSSCRRRRPEARRGGVDREPREQAADFARRTPRAHRLAPLCTSSSNRRRTACRRISVDRHGDSVPRRRGERAPRRSDRGRTTAGSAPRPHGTAATRRPERWRRELTRRADRTGRRLARARVEQGADGGCVDRRAASRYPQRGSAPSPRAGDGEAACAAQADGRRGTAPTGRTAAREAKA